MSKFRVVDYNDVFGNPKDGYEVNGAIIVRNELEIKDDATDKEILNMLIDIDYFISNDLRVLKVQDEGENIVIYRKRDMYPLCGLERIYE